MDGIKNKIVRLSFPWGRRRICVPNGEAHAKCAVVKMTLRSKVWEREIGRRIHEDCCPGELAIDVGAHIGVHTVAMAAGVGTDGEVLAFEPQATLAGCLRETLELEKEKGPKFEVRQTLVSNKVQVLEFCNNGTGRARIPIADNAQQMKLTKNWPRESLGTTTLDLAVPAGSRRCCLIKVDVEGHEFEVLEGAEALIARDRPVVYVEVWQQKGEVLVRKNKWRTDHSAYIRLHAWAAARFYLIERLTANDYRMRPMPEGGGGGGRRGAEGTSGSTCMDGADRGRERDRLMMYRLLRSLEEQRAALKERRTELRGQVAAHKARRERKPAPAPAPGSGSGSGSSEATSVSSGSVPNSDPEGMTRWFEAELMKLPVWELYPTIARRVVDECAAR